MLDARGYTISTYEGDYGEELPINIVRGDILDTDAVKFILEDRFRNVIITKELKMSQNTCFISFTAEEAAKLQADTYLWGLKQYRGDNLVDTLTANNLFRVLRGQ